jgi:hypothetical protein
MILIVLRTGHIGQINLLLNHNAKKIIMLIASLNFVTQVFFGKKFVQIDFPALRNEQAYQDGQQEQRPRCSGQLSCSVISKFPRISTLE